MKKVIVLIGVMFCLTVGIAKAENNIREQYAYADAVSKTFGLVDQYIKALQTRTTNLEARVLRLEQRRRRAAVKEKVSE